MEVFFYLLGEALNVRKIQWNHSWISHVYNLQVVYHGVLSNVWVLLDLWYKSVNTSYLTDSYIIFTLKMESVSKATIFGLKMMVKSGLEKISLKFLHAGHYFRFLHKNAQNLKFSNENDRVRAWRKFENIFSRPLFTIIFRLEMLKFHQYSFLTGDTMVGFVTFYALIPGFF